MVTNVKIRLLALLAFLALLVGGSGLPGERVEDEVEPIEEPAPIFLSDLRWESATTGWVALADDNLPRLNTSFINGTIAVGGKSYDKGIGTFPLSEITYDLGGRYGSFQSKVGVDDSVPIGNGSVVFKLFLDDVLAYDSGVVRTGSAARDVELPVAGVKKMKLVVEDAGDGSTFDYADWADTRLLPSDPQSAQASSALTAVLDAQREARKQQQSQDWETVRRKSDDALAAVSGTFQNITPSAQTRGAFDRDRQLMVLGNDRLAVTLGYGGERNGLVNIIDLRTQTPIALDTTPSISIANAPGAITLRDTQPAGADGYRFRRIEDPALGSGTQMEADFLPTGTGGTVSPLITLYDGTGYLTYQIELRGAHEDADVRKFRFFTPDQTERFVVGDGAGYLTDYSMMRRADVRDDSILRKELVGRGEPILLYDQTRSRGVVMAIIDEVGDPSQFNIQLETGRISAQVGFEYSLRDNERAAHLRSSPRLFLQPVPTSNLEEASADFRRVMAALYPPPLTPSWVKYQWGTWYAFGMNYDEAAVKAQIDYIAQNLADLGPWHILLDAGWYVAEGKPGSSWENVDEAKFPSGLRSLVDYAHSRGIKVVLYFSAPYLDDREREGDWLGLRGFVQEHPNWVIPLQMDTEGASYVYDFSNPELVEYMRRLIDDFFQLYDVDGIKIDGLGQAEGEQLQQQERDTFGDVNKIRMFTMDIYRLVWQEAVKAGKDVYVESGWAIPGVANQFAHTFRYGDEFPALENRYPAPGLLEHIDYAAIQKRLLGQRPNMGMIWGGAESQQMIRLWFEAALAMGTQMTISTDLTRLSSRDLGALRAVLLHYNAFQGETQFVGSPLADSFGTTTGEITYLGAVNREVDTKWMTFKLSDYGLDEHTDYLLYDTSMGTYSRVRGSFQVSLSGVSFRLFLLRTTPGVVWTDSSIETEPGPSSLKLTTRGPLTVTGYAQIYVPSISSVRLDGYELRSSPNLKIGESYSYDSTTGVLRLRYRHDRQHTIEISY